MFAQIGHNFLQILQYFSCIIFFCLLGSFKFYSFVKLFSGLIFYEGQTVVYELSLA